MPTDDERRAPDMKKQGSERRRVQQYLTRPYVKHLTADEFFRILSFTPEAFASAQVRHEVVLAFDRDRPEQPDDYLALDLVAMWLTDRLTDFLGREGAVLTVRLEWGRWLGALAQAEQARSADYQFAVGRCDIPGDESPVFVATGTLDEIKTSLAERLMGEQPTWQAVDMWECAGEVRSLAKATGGGIAPAGPTSGNKARRDFHVGNSDQPDHPAHCRRARW